MFRRAQETEISAPVDTSSNPTTVTTESVPHVPTVDQATAARRKKNSNKSFQPYESLAEFPLRWRDIARVMDRLFFIIVFLSMILVSTFTLCLPYFVSVSVGEGQL